MNFVGTPPLLRRLPISILFWVLLLASVGIGPTARAEPSAASGSENDESWLASPFTTPAEEIYQRAVLHSEGSDASAIMLFQGVEYKFAADGRLEIRRHWIYRVLQNEALEDWSVSQMRWSPWHQERPEIKARVIREGGSVQWLETSALEEKVASEGEARGGKRLLLSGRLPGVEPGAVIEEEIVLREKRAAFPWGTTHRHYTALFIPTVRGRVVLDASTRLALRYGARKMPDLEPASTEVVDGRVRVVFDFHNLPPVEPAEEGLRAHQPRFPHIAFSTGRSWNWVATGLGQLFEKVVTRARLDALASELPLPSDPLRVRLDRILSAIRGRVEYNGLQITASPLDPDPDKVLSEGAGDGFDIALTMVAAFRRVGLESSLALINSGFGIDVEPRLPGFGLFNHALVRVVPGDGAEPVWIDPIAPFTRPGELPLAAQGRFALLIGPDTEKLITTPGTEPAENRAREVREVFFSDFGPGRIVETCEYHGSAERSQRRITQSLEPDARQRGYQAYAHAFHHASNLKGLQETEATDLSVPFQLRLEAINSNRARVNLDHAVLEIPVRELARRLPSVLLSPSENPRRADYVFSEPFVTEWHYVVHPPPGFVALELPGDEEFRMGPATYSHRFRRQQKANGERIVVDLRFDVGQRLLAPSQFEEMKRGLAAFLNRPTLELRLDSTAGHLLESGDFVSAFRDLQTAVSREPAKAGRRVRLSQALLRVGMAQEAEQQARQAVALAPSWGIAHWALAMCLQHDELGRRFSSEAPLDRAMSSLEEAIRLAPGDPTIRATLPRLLNRSTTGRPGRGAQITDAISTYKKWRHDFTRPDLDSELTELLKSQRLWPDLAELLGWTDPGSPLHQAALLMASTVKTVTPENISNPSEVARELVLGREYRMAESVLRAGGEPVWPWLADLKRRDEKDLHPQDPTTPVLRLISAIRRLPTDRREMAAVLHPRIGAMPRSGYWKKLRRDLHRRIPAMAREWDLGPEVWADWIVSGFQPELAGAPHLGYRVKFGDAENEEIFVTSLGGELRIAAFGSQPADLGLEALERLSQGDLVGTTRWLDWARQTLPPAASTDDPLDIEPLRFLWIPDSAKDPGFESLRIVAAALAASVDRSGASLVALQEASVSSLGNMLSQEDSGTRALALEVARLQSFSSSGSFLDLEALAGSLGERYPKSARAFQLQVEALTALGEWSTFVARAEARAESYPRDLDAHRSLGHWSLRLPDVEAAGRHFTVLYEQGKLTPGDAGAWVFALMIDGSPEGVAKSKEILAATEAEGREDAIWLRAEAMILSAEGRVVKARESLNAAIDIQSTRALTVEDGLLIGKMAEGAGLPDVAYERYAHLLSKRDLRERSPLVYALVEGSLKRLQSLR